MSSDEALRPPTATFPYPRRPQRKKCNVENVGKVPAFVSALWSMLNDDRWSDIVHWSPDGTSFIIEDEKALSEHVLPQYFNTISVASFVYNFKRVTDEEVVDEEVATNLLAQINGEKPRRREVVEYRHKFFQRDAPELLTKVIRKTNHRVIKQMMEARQAVRAVQAVAAAAAGGSVGGEGSRSMRSRGRYAESSESSMPRRTPVTSRTLQNAGIQLVGATTTHIHMPSSSTYTNAQMPFHDVDSLDETLAGLVSPSRAEYSRSRRRQGSGDIPVTALLDGDDDTGILETGGAAALVNALAAIGVNLNVDALTAKDPAERQRVNLGSSTPSPVPNLSTTALRNALMRLDVSIDVATLMQLGFPESMALAIANQEATTEGKPRRSRRRSTQTRSSADSEEEEEPPFSPTRRRSARQQQREGREEESSEWPTRTSSRRRRLRADESDLVYDPYTATFTSRETAPAWHSKPAVSLHHEGGTGYLASSNSSLESAGSPALQQAALQLLFTRLQSKSEPLGSSSASSTEDGKFPTNSGNNLPIAQALSQLANSASQLLQTPGGEDTTPGFPTNSGANIPQLTPEQLISAVESLGLAPDVTSALTSLIQQVSQQVHPDAPMQVESHRKQMPNSVFMVNDQGDLVEYDMVAVPYDALMAFEAPKEGTHASASAQLGLAAVNNTATDDEPMRSPNAADVPSHGSSGGGNNNSSSGNNTSNTTSSSSDTPSIIPPQPVVSHDFTSPTSISRPINSTTATTSMAAASATGGGMMMHNHPHTSGRDFGDLTPVLRAFMRQKFADDNHGGGAGSRQQPSFPPYSTSNSSSVPPFEPRLAFASPAAYLRASSSSSNTASRLPRSTISTDKLHAAEEPGHDVFLLSPRSIVKSGGVKLGEPAASGLLQRRGVSSPSLKIAVPNETNANPAVSQPLLLSASAAQHLTSSPLPSSSPAAPYHQQQHLVSVTSLGQPLPHHSSPHFGTGSPPHTSQPRSTKLSESTEVGEGEGAAVNINKKRPRDSIETEPIPLGKRQRSDAENKVFHALDETALVDYTPVEQKGRTPRGAVNARRSLRRLTPASADFHMVSGADSSSSTQTVFEASHPTGEEVEHGISTRN